MCVDIASHLTAAADRPIPETMREQFPALAEEGVLEGELADAMAKAVDLRNLAVHDYLPTAIADLRSFAEQTIACLANVSECSMMSQPQSSSITEDHELDVLSQIHHNQAVKQRDIAHAIGLSLGMTNAILKRLAAKGFISMRRVNARNIHYLVTPDGIDLIARRSYRYLRRTMGHVVRYKERMYEILEAAALPLPEGRGITGVVLVGESDLEFLVEWCAEKAGLSFRHQADALSPGDAARLELVREFVVAGETVRFTVAPGDEAPWDLHLADLVVPARAE